MLTLLKWLMTLISLVLALLPVWFFILIKYLLAPEGFWQNLVLYGFGFWFLAGFQVLFCVLWIIFVCAVWNAPELKN